MSAAEAWSTYSPVTGSAARGGVRAEDAELRLRVFVSVPPRRRGPTGRLSTRAHVLGGGLTLRHCLYFIDEAVSKPSLAHRGACGWADVIVRLRFIVLGRTGGAAYVILPVS